MARKKRPEEHVNHERWLVSYADFITLLFAFFVVMYSVSVINEGKYRVLAEALAAAFRSSPKSLEPIQVGKPVKSPEVMNPKYPQKARQTAIIIMPNQPIKIERPVDLPESKIETSAKGEGRAPEEGRGEQSKEAAAQEAFDQAVEGIMKGMEKMADQIEQSMEELIKEDLILVRRDKYNLSIEVEIKSSILFASGSAELEAEAVPVLWKIANILRAYSYPIQVEGFTDNVPISTVAYPSNWELSAARAASVVHLFMDAGVVPERMSATGYGEYRPIADNNTEQGRRKNRRVVLVILANANARRILEMRRRQSLGAAPPTPIPLAASATGTAPAPAAADGADSESATERLPNADKAPAPASTAGADGAETPPVSPTAPMPVTPKPAAGPHAATITVTVPTGPGGAR